MMTTRGRGAIRTSPHRIRGGWYLVSLAGLLAGLVFALLLAIGIGSVRVPLPAVATVIADHLLGRSPRPGSADQIVWQFRAPRALLAALAGAGLAVSGIMLQTVVRNPLADPYVLGLSQGRGWGPPP